MIPEERNLMNLKRFIAFFAALSLSFIIFAEDVAPDVMVKNVTN